MKRLFPREVLRFVDAWACRVGTPEDEEDELERERGQARDGDREGGAAGLEPMPGRVYGGRDVAVDEVQPDSNAYVEAGRGDGQGQEWVELGQMHRDEEAGGHMERHI